MQKRNLKDAMNEMCDHTVAKIREHVETLLRLDKDEKGGLLKSCELCKGGSIHEPLIAEHTHSSKKYFIDKPVISE